MCCCSGMDSPHFTTSFNNRFSLRIQVNGTIDAIPCPQLLTGNGKDRILTISNEDAFARATAMKSINIQGFQSYNCLDMDYIVINQHPMDKRE